MKVDVKENSKKIANNNAIKFLYNILSINFAKQNIFPFVINLEIL